MTPYEPDDRQIARATAKIRRRWSERERRGRIVDERHRSRPVEVQVVAIADFVAERVEVQDG